MPIELDDIRSGYNLSTINENFQKIEKRWDEKLDRLVSVHGNQMEQDLDMNSNQILNLRAPTDPLDVIRLQDLLSYVIPDGIVGVIPIFIPRIYGDGVSTTFPIVEQAYNILAYQVYISGVKQRPGENFNILSNGDIQFTSPVPNGAEIDISVYTPQNVTTLPAIAPEELPRMMGDGVTRSFNLGKRSIEYQGYEVYVSGVRQKPLTNYVIVQDVNGDSLINFNSAPPPNAEIDIKEYNTTIMVAPKHEWNNTELRFQNTGGDWGNYVNLIGPQGIQGEKGDKGEIGNTGPKGDEPAHEWHGTELRFQNPDGSWGSYANLRGQQGPKGDTGLRGPAGQGGTVIRGTVTLTEGSPNAIVHDETLGDVAITPTTYPTGGKSGWGYIVDSDIKSSGITGTNELFAKGDMILLATVATDVWGKITEGVETFNGRFGVVTPEVGDYAGLYADSFNGRTGAVVPSIGDYAGMYTDSFNGRTGAVTPQAADYSAFYLAKSGGSLTGDLTTTGSVTCADLNYDAGVIS